MSSVIPCSAPSSHGVSISLRPAVLEDAPLLAAWRGEPEVARYQPFEGWTVEEATRDLEHLSAPSLIREGEGRRFRWIIEVDGSPAGWLSLYVSSWSRRTAELAYSLSTPYQRQGIMQRAIRRFLDSDLAETSIRRLEVECLVDNLASCTMIERVGFRLEKTSPRNVVIRGECFDSRLYVLNLPDK